MWVKFVDSNFFSYFFPILLIGFVWVGYYIGRKKYVRKGKAWKSTGVEGSIIGFLALLISFTLLTSGNAMKERVSYIHQQSDAIAEINRLSGFMPDNIKISIKKYLVELINIELAYDSAGTSEKNVLSDDITQCNARFTDYLNTLAKQNDTIHPIVTSILPAYNKLNATTFRLIYSYGERTPGLLFFVIILSSLLIGLLIGFMNSFNETVHVLVPLIYIILVSLTINTIRDLDNPYKGSIKPTYQNVKNLKNMILTSIKKLEK